MSDHPYVSGVVDANEPANAPPLDNDESTSVQKAYLFVGCNDGLPMGFTPQTAIKALTNLRWGRENEFEAYED